MKTVTINNIKIKITKKEIKNSIQSDLRFDFGEVARDVFSILIMTVRNIDFQTRKEFILVDKINYVYENAELLIKNAAFHHTSIAFYFGLPKVS